MARRLNNVDVGTVRRHRRQAKKAGLIEVLGHGRDRKPCLVRPILLDGTPVFPGPELVGKTGTFAGLTQAILPADLLLTDLPEAPPYPPRSRLSTSAVEGEAEIDLAEEEAAPEPAPISASEPASTPASTPIPAPMSNPTSDPKSKQGSTTKNSTRRTSKARSRRLRRQPSLNVPMARCEPPRHPKAGESGSRRDVNQPRDPGG
jgi:hypothetical protein